MNSRTRRLLAGAGCFTAGIAAATVVSWAFVTVGQPVEDPLDTPGFTLVKVAPGAVGSSLQLNTIAEWRPALAAVNRGSGVVTEVAVKPGDEVVPGSVIYRVNLHPVVVAHGDVPAFRDIMAGSTGTDVRQLQQFLHDSGYYTGEVNGKAGPATTGAIRAWQKKLGVEQTGVIAAGDIIFVPSLPARVMLDSDIVYRGASLSGGEHVLSTLPAAPTFTLPVTDAQAAMMPEGTRVEIAAPDGETWRATVESQTRDESTGTVTVTLSGTEETTICGDQCGDLPVVGQSILASRVVTVETVKGLTVPSSALVSGAGGQMAVIDQTGKRISVAVVTSARGISLVEGVPEGIKVRVPGVVDQ